MNENAHEKVGEVKNEAGGEFAQVRLCVDTETLKPIDCETVGIEPRTYGAGPILSACPMGPGALIGFPKYHNPAAAGVPWGLLLGFSATAALVLLGLALLQQYLSYIGVIPVRIPFGGACPAVGLSPHAS